MAKDTFQSRCQNCGHLLAIEKMHCPGCDLSVSGNVALPRLARLAPETREFIELFVLSAGSLKEVGKILNLSYPTVRSRLDNAIADLQGLNHETQSERLEILRKLEEKEISAAEAVKMLEVL